MVMVKGEIMFLLSKTNPDWWSVRKVNGQDGFVPANYVKEVEPKVMQVSVRKVEKIPVSQKVRKTKMVKQVVPVKKIVTKVPTRAPRKPSENENRNIEKRQKKINSTYDDILDLSKKRHALLEDSIMLFGFYRECDDFEKWIKDREKMLRSEDKSDSVETAKRKYEKFVTDLSASSKRIEALDVAVDEFVKQGHSQLDKVIFQMIPIVVIVSWTLWSIVLKVLFIYTFQVHEIKVKVLIPFGIVELLKFCEQGDSTFR